MARATKMQVIVVDQTGKQVGDAEWVDIPAPDSFPNDGFAQIENYVT